MPAGIANPIVAGLLTKAVQGVLPPSAPLTVRLPAPAGALLPPQLRDMPIELLGQQSSSEPGATPSRSALIALLAQERSRAASHGVPLPPLPHSFQSPAGDNWAPGTDFVRPCLRSAAGSAGAPPGSAGASISDFILMTVPTTASQLQSQGLTSYSAALVRRARVRRGHAGLAGRTAQGAGQEHVPEGPALAVHEGAAGGGSVAQAAMLDEVDLAYVTLAVPPRLKHTPDVHLTSRPAPPPSPPPPPAPPESLIHLRSVMASVLAQEVDKAAAVALTAGYGGLGSDGIPIAGTTFIPTFLRNKREPVVPHTRKLLGAAKAFNVPAFNSASGFNQGFFDEDSATLHFD